MTDAERLASDAVRRLPFEPNDRQLLVLTLLARFVTGHADREAFILNGYAGTGKSSVIGALAEAMKSARMKFALLAPTGRAAKVAGSLAGQPASTIHRRIFHSVTSESGKITFQPAHNPSRDTIFFVDEASMIANPRDPSRSLLVSLLRYVYSAPGCAIVFIGDAAQLPPIGEGGAPALSPQVLARYGVTAYRNTLDAPGRQASDSGILWNATLVRRSIVGALKSGKEPVVPKMRVAPFPDVRIISTLDLAEELADSWRRTGGTGTLLVTRSNYRANGYNQAVRREVLGAEEPLVRGERLVMAKNNYFWSRRNKSRSFIANGETAVVEWVGRTEKRYGRWFVDVELRFPEDNALIGGKIMLRSLAAEGPAVPAAEMERLYNTVLLSYDGELSERMAAVEEDEWYNALQAKYAYCVTCHKAQGGEWSEVFVDMSGLDVKEGGVDLPRWLYTAMTRARDRLYLINPPAALLDAADVPEW